MLARGPREQEPRIRRPDMVVGRSPWAAADKQPRAADQEAEPPLEREPAERAPERVPAGRPASTAAQRSKAKRRSLGHSMPIPAKHCPESHTAADSNR